MRSPTDWFPFNWSCISAHVHWRLNVPLCVYKAFLHGSCEASQLLSGIAINFHFLLSILLVMKQISHQRTLIPNIPVVYSPLIRQQPNLDPDRTFLLSMTQGPLRILTHSYSARVGILTHVERHGTSWNLCCLCKIVTQPPPFRYKQLPTCTLSPQFNLFV